VKSVADAVQFKARMEIRDGNPYLLVNAIRATALQKGWRKPMPVLVRINGLPRKPWKINMMPVGDGSFYLYLHNDVRKASRTKVGDQVEVELRLDQEYRGGPAHPMPAWFGKALAADASAKAAWDVLPPSRRKEVLRYFSWLKSDVARARNLEKVMAALSGKTTRFMARTWVDGK
jgi:hypothetical protein